MEIPSDTPIVLNLYPTRPASSTPSFTSSARSLRCMLHVFPSHHTEEMPTCGLDISSGVKPVPYSIAWDAPCDFGCVIRELNLFRSEGTADFEGASFASTSSIVACGEMHE